MYICAWQLRHEQLMQNQSPHLFVNWLVWQPHKPLDQVASLTQMGTDAFRIHYANHNRLWQPVARTLDHWHYNGRSLLSIYLGVCRMLAPHRVRIKL